MGAEFGFGGFRGAGVSAGLVGLSAEEAENAEEWASLCG